MSLKEAKRKMNCESSFERPARSNNSRLRMERVLLLHDTSRSPVSPNEYDLWNCSIDFGRAMTIKQACVWESPTNDIVFVRCVVVPRSTVDGGIRTSLDRNLQRQHQPAGQVVIFPELPYQSSPERSARPSIRCRSFASSFPLSSGQHTAGYDKQAQHSEQHRSNHITCLF